MPRANQNKLYRTFVRGLITEAGFLTYPEDSSSDELNTVLFRKGNRTRRLGQTYASRTADATLEETDRNIARNEFVWKAVGNKPNTNFLVTQIGTTLSFFDLRTSDAIANKKAFSIDLSSYIHPFATPDLLEKSIVHMAAGKGLLFIVNENTEPLSVQYNKEDDTITVTSIKILTRDFEGMFDGLQNDEEPTILSKEHHYNLQNQGWVTGNRSSTTFSPIVLDGYTYEPEVVYYEDFTYGSTVAYQNSVEDSPIFKFQTATGRYPGNNKQWWVTKAAADDTDAGIVAGDFLPLLLEKQFSGNNKAPRGHYILDAFRKDRTAVSGVSGINIDEKETRPNAITFFSGRAWYGSESTVYYSQILDNNNSNKAGLCYQEADPTAEDISELIASDGGEVVIPEIDRIERLMPMANGVVVFAQNGVWFISGGDSAFSATNISVSKVSPIGTVSPLSIIETDGSIYWWSEIGVQALQQSAGQFGPIPGSFANTNISEQTIQTFYNEDIPADSKPFVKAQFDTRNNIIYWLYRDGDLTNNYEFNRTLQFDITLQAFYPWKFGSIENGPRITGFFLDTGFAEDFEEQVVTDNSGVIVTNEAGDNVTSNVIDSEVRPSNIYYTVDVPEIGLALSQTEDATFADWVSFNGDGIGYESYIETGYELHNDAMRRKQIVYLFAHFRRTENNEGEDPSSCYLTTKWDWSNRAFSNKWSSKFQAYRQRTRPDPTTQERIEGFDVTTSKNKIRGSGKAVQFRFGTDEIGKNFDLLGWSVAYVGNTQP